MVSRPKLAPGASETLIIRAADVDAHLESGVAPLVIETRRAGGERFTDVKRTVTLVRRTEAHDPEMGHPALGDRFTALSLVDGDEQVFQLPLGGAPFRALFLTPDCAAMFPELDDVAWLAREGRLDGGAQPLVITDKRIRLSGYMDRWSLQAARQGSHGQVAPDEVNDANAHLDPGVYPSFELREIKRIAPYPTDYIVDSLGEVIRIERVYRGLHPLE